MEIKLPIETNRLFLRLLTTDDIPSFFRIFSDAETMKYASNGPLSFEQTVQQIQEYREENKKHAFGVCALVLKETGGVIGYCGLEWHWLENNWQPELVYCLSKEYGGKGLALEAAAAVKKHVMENLKINKLISLIKPGNSASIRLVEKLGARLIGEITIQGISKLKYTYLDNKEVFNA